MPLRFVRKVLCKTVKKTSAKSPRMTEEEKRLARSMVDQENKISHPHRIDRPTDRYVISWVYRFWQKPMRTFQKCTHRKVYLAVDRSILWGWWLLVRWPNGFRQEMEAVHSCDGDGARQVQHHSLAGPEESRKDGPASSPHHSAGSVYRTTTLAP